mmetsp:Transcript_46399/g.118463  ORF Transcript_46399/g.118463 Transcript_46399/m.118463 type:complete len:233 (-) Transcript_46399:434-1132(-)
MASRPNRMGRHCRVSRAPLSDTDLMPGLLPRSSRRCSASRWKASVSGIWWRSATMASPSGAAVRKGMRQPWERYAASDMQAAARKVTVLARRMPQYTAEAKRLVPVSATVSLLLRSMLYTTAAGPSPLTNRPCTALSSSSTHGGAAPRRSPVGRQPIRVVAADMPTMVASMLRRRPKVSATQPNRNPPSGRTRKVHAWPTHTPRDCHSSSPPRREKKLCDSAGPALMYTISS